jgi:Acetylornithine deacetylase/Succinyl-diaminopimelate desuccinylase and related deacylases
MISRVVVCLTLLATAAAAQDRAMPPQAERDLARAIYKEMVETKTGYTTGATTPLVQAVAKRLRAAGFPARDIFVGGPIPTKANLVVRYHGTGRQRPLLLLAHTDVVEAKREDWSMDPYTLTEKEATSTAEASATTSRRRPPGSRTSFATSVKASRRTATSSSR